MRLFWMLLLAGCVTTEVPQQPDYAVAVVRNPSARIPPGGSFSLVRGPFGAAEDTNLDLRQVDGMLRSAIRDAMAELGYAPGFGGGGDLLVGYAVVLDRGFDDTAMNLTYGLSPGWTPGGLQAGEYERGMIVIDVMRGGSRRSLWRGAIQGEVDETLSPARRRERIEGAVRRLLASLG
jgi:hypothetical protein